VRGTNQLHTLDDKSIGEDVQTRGIVDEANGNDYEY
jgi:hypothetical protein